jgi:hypothetical protein
MQIENTLTNRQLYKKAYLIEFYSNNPARPDAVFTFAIPPESEELAYPQRKTETKTFGGLHVDDYGADAVKINLSGSTINQSIKRIYVAGVGSDKWLSGEDEIYHFRNLILQYKSLDFLTANRDAKILIYDLSKFTGLRPTGESAVAIENYWQAFPGEFKIRRASDRPFTYKYSFEFTGIPFSDSNIRSGVIPMGSQALGILQSTLNGIKTALDFINNVEAWVDDAMGYVNQVSELLNILGNVMTRSTTAITNIMGTVSGATAGVIGGVANTVNGVNSIVSLPRTVQLKALSIGLDMQNATNRLIKSTATLAKNCRAIFDDTSYQIPQEVQDQYALNNEEFKDSINIMLNKAESAACELVVMAQSSEIPEVTEGNPDPVTGIPSIVLSYGSTPIMLKETDNLESLAVEYLGDPDKAIDIATYNGVATLSDLEPGDVIRIPITERTVRMINNLIFGRREDRDNYGRDVLLTDDGFIVASNTGDYELSIGVKTLTQSVLLRLRESNAKRIRIMAYGIRTSVSDPAAGAAYVMASIRLTVNSDPRVATVDDVWFRAIGDFLDIRVSYHDINNANNRTAGRI